uniref:Dymeclin n=1 Tax=Schistocephalus solidus TaxID=70667 RepID=A0A0X3P105_SCHSO
MGSTVSSLADLSTNPFLIKLVGQESIQVNSDYWANFLLFNFPTPLTNDASFYLEAAVSSFLQRFYRNDLRTHNFSALLQQFIMKATGILGSAKMGLVADLADFQMAKNSLLVIRLFSKYILENPMNHGIELHFAEPVVTSEYFVHLLFRLIIDVAPSNESYALLYEVVCTMLVFLSAQVSKYGADEVPVSCGYFISKKCLSDAPSLVRQLLIFVHENVPCPPSMLDAPYQPGILWNAASTLASGLISVLTLGFARRQSKPVPPDDSQSDAPFLNPLAKQSCFLLLVLTTQSNGFTQAADDSESIADERCSRSIFRILGNNPYRTALFALAPDEPASLAVPASGQSPQKDRSSEPVLTVNFEAICNTLALTIESDASVLLLYLLLHRNDVFRARIMETRSYEKFVIPICSLLYRSPAANSHLVYMALIIILILTENERFVKDIHEMPVKKPPPMMDRQLTGVSLGSLLVLVLTRTIQHHLSQLKDKYLHINSLAALANLSPKIVNLHPYVSQALVGLLQRLVKRHKRLVTELRNQSEEQNKEQQEPSPTNATVVDASSPVPSVKVNLAPSANALLQDLSLLEEVIRMALEIFNAILTHSLTSNTHLIYALLYQREYLTPLQSHPAFQDVMQNIDIVLTYFASRIEKELGAHPTETSSVMAVITKSVGNFSRSRTLKEFQELKFKYVEEESPDEFFIPYLWSLVYRLSGLALDQKALHCLGQVTTYAEDEAADATVGTGSDGAPIA